MCLCDGHYLMVKNITCLRSISGWATGQLITQGSLLLHNYVKKLQDLYCHYAGSSTVSYSPFIIPPKKKKKKTFCVGLGYFVSSRAGNSARSPLAPPLPLSPSATLYIQRF